MSNIKSYSDEIRQDIINGKTALGIELGSSRIKAVLIDKNHKPIASGSYSWENRLEDGIWTYSMEDVWLGLQACFAELSDEVKEKYDTPLETVGSMGVSAMMHGYLAFDKDSNLLVPFRTWRNTTTEQAASELTKEFNFNIPQRWSVAHIYQAILDTEEHVENIKYITTLAGYVHFKLTGENVLGVGEASGMFPVESSKNDYNQVMLSKFDNLVEKYDFDWKLKNILPKVLTAGEKAGKLTEAGAKLLDPTGKLKSGIPLCPPEGDAGTGMVATNSVSERTGNVSAGTSVFAMIVLEHDLSDVYTEIDMVTTPTGKPVAMVHCNNFTSDFDAWVRMFKEVLDKFDADIKKPELYDMLYYAALDGEPDCGGLLSYNYYSGEPITQLDEGRPLFVRTPDSNLSISNFIRNLLFSAMGTLKIGMDILSDKENVELDKLQGHGGFFKTKEAGQKLMASALNVPVVVMESAGEGGAWGIALLADYMVEKKENETLEDYLDKRVFGDNTGSKINPDEKDRQGFEDYMKRYKKGLAIERAAIENMD